MHRSYCFGQATLMNPRCLCPIADALRLLYTLTCRGMAQCSQPQPPPLRLEALPDDAVQAISRCPTTPSCPGPCQLAPVSKAWRRAALQHLAGATVALRLGCVADWEDTQLQQRQLQERQQNLQGGHLEPSHGPSNSKNRQTGVRAAALKAIGTPQQRLQAATQADQQRLTSLAAWLLQHGPCLGGLALTLAAPPCPNSAGEAAAQQAVSSQAARVTRVVRCPGGSSSSSSNHCSGTTSCSGAE